MITNERLLDCTEARNHIPRRRGAARIHPSTVHRWMRRGIRARSGHRIRLECLRVGSRLLTSEEALTRFFEEVAKADAEYFDRPDVARTVVKGSPEPQRGEEIRRAEAELSEAGMD